MTDPFRGSASGLTPSRLRNRRYRRLTRDVYVLSTAADSLALAVDAALTAVPDAVASHQTAARLQGLPVDPDGVVHLTRPAGGPVTARPGTRTHRAALEPADVIAHRGRPVTSPARTFLDLAAVLPHLELVVLADAVSRRTGLPELARCVAGARGRRGVRRAQAALALADPLADSAAETRCRLVLHAAGFASLRHGLDVSDGVGGWLARPDLADADRRVAVQYDGLVHLGDDPEQRRADIDRDELLRQERWQVVVLTAIDLRYPERMVAKVAAAYARSTEWRVTTRFRAENG